MKGTYDPYVSWLFDKKLISLLEMRIRTGDYTVYEPALFKIILGQLPKLYVPTFLV